MKLNGLITYAPDAWRFLNGTFCLYKPPNISINKVIESIKLKLVNDLNRLELRPVNYINEEKNVRDYSDDVLSLGCRYEKEEIFISSLTGTSFSMSGLCLFSINTNYNVLRDFKKSREINVYHCSGVFGKATDDYMSSGKTVLRTKYCHITAPKLERVLSVILSLYQKELIKYLGVDIKSQKAYELASQNLIRPTELSPPVISGIKLVQYNRPSFTLEISCINETPPYLSLLIHDLALKLKSSAHCSGLRRIKLGPFNVKDSLSYPQWNLQNIINNISHCWKPLNQAIAEGKLRNNQNQPLNTFPDTSYETMPQLLNIA